MRGVRFREQESPPQQRGRSLCSRVRGRMSQPCPSQVCEAVQDIAHETALVCPEAPVVVILPKYCQILIVIPRAAVDGVLRLLLCSLQTSSGDLKNTLLF